MKPRGVDPRVLRGMTGSMWVFGSMRYFLRGDLRLDGWTFVQDVVWRKHNGSSFLDDRFRRVHEHALQFRRDDSAWADVYHATQYSDDATARVVRRKRRPAHLGKIERGHYVAEDGGPRMVESVVDCPSAHGYAIHPTQKPEELVRLLVEYACPPGGTVLDPFAGSATTGVVSLLTGRGAVLVEKDPENAARAFTRLATTAPLFAGRAT